MTFRLEGGCWHQPAMVIRVAKKIPTLASRELARSKTNPIVASSEKDEEVRLAWIKERHPYCICYTFSASSKPIAKQALNWIEITYKVTRPNLWYFVNYVGKQRCLPLSWHPQRSFFLELCELARALCLRAGFPVVWASLLYCLSYKTWRAKTRTWNN